MNPRLEKILKLPLYQRILIVGVIVVLIAAGYYFLLYAPKVEEYDRLKADYTRLYAKLQEDRRIAADLPKFKAEYEKMQQKLERALAELPNEKEIPTLLTSISSLAKDQGLDILRFKPLAEVPKGFYAEVPVQLKLVGPYHDVATFFDRVGKLSRIVNIGQLAIGKGKTEDGHTEVTVECLATTFRFVESGAAAPPPQGNQKK